MTARPGPGLPPRWAPATGRPPRSATPTLPAAARVHHQWTRRRADPGSTTPEARQAVPSPRRESAARIRGRKRPRPGRSPGCRVASRTPTKAVSRPENHRRHHRRGPLRARPGTRPCRDPRLARPGQRQARGTGPPHLARGAQPTRLGTRRHRPDRAARHRDRQDHPRRERPHPRRRRGQPAARPAAPARTRAQEGRPLNRAASHHLERKDHDARNQPGRRGRRRASRASCGSWASGSRPTTASSATPSHSSWMAIPTGSKRSGTTSPASRPCSAATTASTSSHPSSRQAAGHGSTVHHPWTFGCPSARANPAGRGHRPWLHANPRVQTAHKGRTTFSSYTGSVSSAELLGITAQDSYSYGQGQSSAAAPIGFGYVVVSSNAYRRISDSRS